MKVWHINLVKRHFDNSASCNFNFTAGSYEEACDQLLDYLKDSVTDGDVTSWFINEE